LLGQPFAPVNLRPPLVLVIRQNDLSIPQWDPFQATVEAALALVGFGILELRVNGGRVDRFLIDIDEFRFLTRFEEHQIGYPVGIGTNVVDLLALVDSSRYAVEHFVGSILS
jgi:hypothetical protein